MRRALVSLATGPHRELLDIAWPSFEEFADRHGYELIEAETQAARPPSWWKIPVLHDLLTRYGEVLWVDADVVIVDPTEDLSVPPGAWQAVVAHHTGDGEVPNLGVWLARRMMLPVLERIWGMTEFLEHPWWEQAAMVTLLGYGGTPLKPAQPSELRDRTCFLGPEWNRHKNDVTGCGHVRFQHATMHTDRAAVMRAWAKAAFAGIPGDAVALLQSPGATIEETVYAP